MNKKIANTFLFLGIFISIISSQAQDLNTLVSEIQRHIQPVQTASKNFETKVEVIQPGLLRYGYDEIDSKGNRTTYAYEFNLADVDPYAVREHTQKDAIYSVLAIRNKQKLVKVFKNNEVEPYANDVSIIAKDIETARAINEAVKKAIPLAEKEVSKRLNLSGYDAAITWLTNNVKDVSVGSKTYVQSLMKGEKIGTLVFKEVTTDSKSSSEEVFTFNLADLNLNTINFKITGNRFAINAETLRKDKYIRVQKNGETKPYVSEITINTNGVNEARDLKTALTIAIPLAVEKVKEDMPNVNSEKDGLLNIRSGTGEVKIGTKQITQELEPNCLCTLTQTERDPKTTVVNVYKFNWMDLNPTTSQIDVTGDKLYIDLQTIDKKKMIMYTKSDKFNGYESGIKLYMSDIEGARRVKAAIDKVIEKCKANYKEPFGSDANSMISWLLTNVKDATLEDVTMKQTLEQVESGKNEKLKFTSRELNSKGTGAEEIYEFNLADVNPLSIDMVTKGKWLYVTMESEFKNKIFNYYKDGKIQPYASKIEFAVNNTEQARNIKEALKKSTSALKKK